MCTTTIRGGIIAGAIIIGTLIITATHTTEIELVGACHLAGAGAVITTLIGAIVAITAIVRTTVGTMITTLITDTVLTMGIALIMGIILTEATILITDIITITVQEITITNQVVRTAMEGLIAAEDVLL